MIDTRIIRSVVLVVASSGSAYAHESTGPARAGGWSWEPFVVAPLLASALLYAIGTVRLRRNCERVPVWPVVSFALGWLSLVAALDSPIDTISAQLFSVHMTQHEILMLVAAPLLVMGRPLVAMLWAFPLSWRERLGRFAKTRPFALGWGTAATPLVAWSAHALALWIWHAPALFDAALDSEAVHALQHLCFLGTALLFWWTLIHGRHGRLSYGAAIVYVFTTAAHNSILGALLTFASKPWYGSYGVTAPAWGLTGVEDQQLGGLIMWVPAGTLLAIIGLALLAAWMGESERRFEYTRTAALLRAGGGGHAQ